MDAFEAVVVTGHGHVMQRHGVHAVIGEFFLGKRHGDLTATVGAEVEAHHRVIGLDAALGGVAYHGRLNEFIGNACSVALGKHLIGGVGHGAGSVHQQVPGFGHAFPALVAVHGKVATDHRYHLGGGAFQVGLQIGHERASGLGIGVTPIGKGVDADFAHASGLCNVYQGFEVVLVRVHATGTQKAHQVQASAALNGVLHRRLQHRVGCKFSALYSAVDAQQVLVHHAACAYVHVSHFGVAHLAFGQAYEFTVGAQGGVGVLAEQGVHHRGVGHVDGVGVVGGAIAPTVEDHKCYVFSHD